MDFVCRESKSIDENEKVELVSFAKRVCQVEERYLESRFQQYEKIIVLKKAGKTCAFQLLQTFEEQDETFIYFGPLFSRMSCFVDLFLSYLRSEMELIVNRNIHLLAEIQNPEVLLLFKALFEDYALPMFGERTIPDDIKKKLLLFSRKLSHIHDLDLNKFTTTSKETLYQSKTIPTPIDDWLMSRSIDVSKGENVLLYSFVPSERTAREELILQLERGRQRMRNWKEGKKEVLTLFMQGVVTNA